MRGSINWQVAQVIQQSTAVQIGESRHEAKELARQELEEQDLPLTSENLGKEIGLHSYEYTRDVKEMLLRVAFFAREMDGTRDIETLTGEHFQQFGEALIAKGEISYSTWRVYLAQMSKCENLLAGYAEATGSGREYEIRPAIEELRALGKASLEATEKCNRAYDDPRALIGTMEAQPHQLGASIQYEGGLRYYEMAKIDPDQLEGIRQDRYTGQTVGVIRLDGHDTKGGKGREVSVSVETYRALESHIRAHGVFRVDYDGYLGTLKVAAAATGQAYHASHGLRWNFAQERYIGLTRNGRCHEEALHIVSWDMGHERGNITQHYLGG